MRVPSHTFLDKEAKSSYHHPLLDPRATKIVTDQLAESSGRRLARRDVAILKAILCQGLYPQFAVADAGNAGRASNEQQYVTRPSGGLFMSPSSVLACQDFGVVGACGEGSGGGWRGSAARGADGGIAASRGAAADAGRSDGLLCYGQLMETQRPFVSSVTPLPALQALLLFSARVDTSEDASMVGNLHAVFAVFWRGGVARLLDWLDPAIVCHNYSALF